MAGPENSRSSRKEKIRSRFRTVMHYAACHIKSNLAQAAHLPFFKGLLFRDHFGKQLKKVACLYKKGQCHSCRATALCDYARYFEMPGSLPDSLRPAMASPPRPFVIEPPETQETRLPGGSPFDFNLLLFGGALRAAPTFIRALEAMGEAGIGPDNVPFEIKSVVCGKQTIYQAGKTVRPGIPDAEEISMPDMEESSGGQLTLSLALRTP